MRFHRNGYVEITGRTSLYSVFTFVGKPQSHAGFDPGGNLHGQHSLLVDALASLARTARIRNDLPATLALPAGSTDAEEPLLEAQLAGTLAAGAHFDGIRG